MNEKRIFRPNNLEEMLKGWLLHCHKERDRHNEAARAYDRYHHLLGVSAIILSAFVGTSVFASLSQNAPDLRIRIIVGMLSVLATILAALVTFYKFAEQAEKHRATATKNKAIIRELEFILSQIHENDWDFQKDLSDMQKKLDDLEVDSPVISQGIYNRIEKRFDKVRFCEDVEQLAGAIEDSSEPVAQ